VSTRAVSLPTLTSTPTVCGPSSAIRSCSSYSPNLRARARVA